MQQRGGQVLPVYLKCSTEEIIRRVGNADRVARKKMTDEDSVRNFTARYRLTAVPRASCLVLDSEARSPEANAEAIIRHFGLADLQRV